MPSSPSLTTDRPGSPGTLDIVLVNWNTGPLLRECLQSIASSQLPAGWAIGQVVVVDNASADASAESLALPGIPLRVVKNDINRGFGAACNQGAANSRADLLLFLNPDTRLFANSLARPISRLVSGARERVGIVGVQLVDETGAVARTCSRFPKARHFFCQALALNRIWPRLSQSMSEWDHAETREVDQIMGAFFMMSRDLFEQLNGFDERFFVYFEEVDLAYRAARRGWRSVYLADSQAFHLGGGSSRKVLALRLMYSLRSRLLYAGKHFGPGGRLLTWLSTLVLEPPMRILHALATSGPAGAAAAWRGYCLLLRALRKQHHSQP